MVVTIGPEPEGRKAAEARAPMVRMAMYCMLTDGSLA